MFNWLSSTLSSASRRHDDHPPANLSPLTTRLPQHRTSQPSPGPAVGVPGLPQGRMTPAERESSFHAIADTYKTLDDVIAALRREGLESSNLIVAVDFTKSNEWTGKFSNGGRSLHSLTGPGPNPYEAAIATIGRTLESFDDDGIIPCYGFGDGYTQDQSVFSFNDGDRPCRGVNEVLQRYRQLAGVVKLAGPTSFAPAIDQAMHIVARSGNQYHILLIVADGQVTRSSDLEDHQLSPQEEATIRAIVAASRLPLSIIMVGVGDGPWDSMHEFDDKLPQRAFDNFQFVNFTELSQRFPASSSSSSTSSTSSTLAQPPASAPGPASSATSTGTSSGPREAAFALRALMEIPDQYKTMQRMGILGRPGRAPLPPLPGVLDPPPTLQQAPMPAGAPPAGQPQPASGYPKQQHPQHYNPQAHPAAPSSSYASPSAPSAPPLVAGVAAASGAPGATPAAGTSSALNLPDTLFVCPITQDVMDDPVIAADGYSYERSAIEAWLKGRSKSPMTNQDLPNKNLIPNHALRSSIMEWRQRQQQAAGASGKQTC